MVKENFFNSELNPKSSNKKLQSSSPFNEGEVFDPEKELKNLSKLHGVEGLDQLTSYKEKLKFQKESIAGMREDILNFVENNKDFSKTDLENIAQKNFSTYGLTSEQKQKTLDVINELYKKHIALKELVEKYKNKKGEIDSDRLYKDLFKKDLKGKIKIVDGPFYIYLRFSDLEDYSYVASDAYKSARELTQKDISYGRSVIGAKMNSSPIKKIEGTIIIENPLHFEDEEESKNILKHEKEHVFHNFIDKYHMPDLEQRLKKFIKNDSLSADKELILLINNPKIEKEIKDEICAYFKDGTSPKEISERLLEDGTIYDYGLDYNLTEDKFSPEYLELVENGIIAFANLVKAGKSIDIVKNLLYLEPLQKWPKEAERLLGKVKTPTEKERDKYKYISKLILKREIKS